MQKEYLQQYRSTVADNYGKHTFESALDLYNTYDRFLHNLDVLNRPYIYDQDVDSKIRDSYHNDIYKRLEDYT